MAVNILYIDTRCCLFSLLFLATVTCTILIVHGTTLQGVAWRRHRVVTTLAMRLIQMSCKRSYSVYGTYNYNVDRYSSFSLLFFLPVY